MNNVKDGDVILMHEIYQASLDAAKMLIPALIQQGYQLVTVSDLAASRHKLLRQEPYTEQYAEAGSHLYGFCRSSIFIRNSRAGSEKGALKALLYPDLPLILLLLCDACSHSIT